MILGDLTVLTTTETKSNMGCSYIIREAISYRLRTRSILTNTNTRKKHQNKQTSVIKTAEHRCFTLWDCEYMYLERKYILIPVNICSNFLLTRERPLLQIQLQKRVLGTCKPCTLS